MPLYKYMYYKYETEIVSYFAGITELKKYIRTSTIRIKFNWEILWELYAAN